MQNIRRKNFTGELREKAYVPSRPIKKLIVVLHGFSISVTEPKLVEVASRISKKYNVPVHCPKSPFYMLHWWKHIVPLRLRSWYDFSGYDREKFLGDEVWREKWRANMLPSILRTIKLLEDYIDKLLIKYNLEPKDVILAGFSQGGLIAQYLGLNGKFDVAGVVSMSGAPLFFNDNMKKNIKRRPKTLLTHGTADKLVPIKDHVISVKDFKEMGVDVEEFVEDGLGHDLSDVSLAVAEKFLEKLLDIKND